MNRLLDDISEDDCYIWFALNRANMRLIFLHGRVPDTLRNPTNWGSIFRPDVLPCMALPFEKRLAIY